MSHHIATNYSMPNISNSIASNTVAKANTTPSSGSGSTSSDPYGAANIGSTFLNLLTQELQNQDPTAPMDSTAMVGQMISLNQLDQLMTISQAITGTSGSSSTTAAASGGSVNANAQKATLAGANTLLSPSSTGLSPVTDIANSLNSYYPSAQPASTTSQSDIAQQRSLSAFPIQH